MYSSYTVFPVVNCNKNEILQKTYQTVLYKCTLLQCLFEIITSEASYVKSIDLLISHFYKSPQLSAEGKYRNILSKEDRKVLFSNVTAVIEVAHK